MSEEVASPAAPAAPVAAPAAPVATEAPIAAPTAESAAIPATSEINWDDWNGEVGDLPEDHRPLAEGMNGWYSRSFEGKLQEIEELRAVYTAMLNEEDDPRLGNLQKELEEAKSSLEERTQEHTENQENYQKLMDLTVRDYVERFWNDHADLREDKAKLAQFADFLSDSELHGGAWEGYVAAQLINLPAESIQIAAQAKRDGVADEYALKLAMAHAQLSSVESTVKETKQEAAKEIKKQASKPRPAARITNGATGASRPQPAASQGMREAKTLDQMRSIAAQRALRVHSGGKK